jgi:hypothetical protein
VSHHTERSQIGVREKTSPGTHRFWIRELANSDTPRVDRCQKVNSRKGVNAKWHRGSGVGDP